MSSILLCDDRFLDHVSGVGGPERPDRIRVLRETLEDRTGPGWEHLRPEAISREALLRAHAAEHVARIEAADGKTVQFDGDTATTPPTVRTAILAAGGVRDVVEAVAQGKGRNGFALVRPPGHHAETKRAMGFCFFNNVAVAAHHLLAEHDLERLLILDWDVHHGNGTQEIFYSDPRVLFLSLHQHPLYPGTGMVSETGAGEGRGTTVNIPLPPGCHDADYEAAFERVVLPVADRFGPQFVLISAGFDAHARDPLASMELTSAGFAWMARRLQDLANEHAESRLVACLEGGYDLQGLKESAEAVLDELAGQGPGTYNLEGPELPAAATVLDAVTETHGL